MGVVMMMMMARVWKEMSARHIFASRAYIEEYNSSTSSVCIICVYHQQLVHHGKTNKLCHSKGSQLTDMVGNLCAAQRNQLNSHHQHQQRASRWTVCILASQNELCIWSLELTWVRFGRASNPQKDSRISPRSNLQGKSTQKFQPSSPLPSMTPQRRLEET